MQTWVAVSLLLGQGVFLIVAFYILRAFGVYVETMLSTQRQNLKIRENMAIMENDVAVAHLHRRSTDPLPEQEREA